MKLNELEKVIFEGIFPLASFSEGELGYDYAKQRKIPFDKLNRLYWVDNLSSWQSSNNRASILHVHALPVVADSSRPSGLKDALTQTEVTRHQLNDSFLLAPLRSKEGLLHGFLARRIGSCEKTMRLFFVSVFDRPLQPFGLEFIDTNKTIYVSEGIIDSLYFENSFSPPGCLQIFELLQTEWFSKLDKRQLIFLLDHEPGIWISYSWSRYLIEHGYKVCVFPIWMRHGDINDFIRRGWSQKRLQFMILLLSSIPSRINLIRLKILWRLYRPKKS